jgi:hypothetical protein
MKRQRTVRQLRPVDRNVTEGMLQGEKPFDVFFGESFGDLGYALAEREKAEAEMAERRQVKGQRKHKQHSRRQEEVPRAAYVISVHDHRTIQGLLNLLDVMYTLEDTFVVHVDSKVSDCIHLRLVSHLKQNFPTVQLLSHRHDVRWGKMSIVDMTLHMIDVALQSNRSWDVLVNLCSYSRPTSSNAYRQFVFAQLPRQANFFGKLDKISDREDPMYHRTPARCVPPNWKASTSRPLTKAKAAAARKHCTRMSHTPGNHLVYKGEQWAYFSRDFSHYLVTDQLLVPRWYEFFKQTVIPDESFFQSVLLSSPYKHTITRTLRDSLYNVNITSPIFTTWVRPCRFRKGDYAPCYLGTEDMSLIYPNALFTRKVRAGDPLDTALMAALMTDQRKAELGRARRLARQELRRISKGL